MLAIDVFSAYVICGVGSLVGAAMLQFAHSPQADEAVAFRFCTWAFALLGISLVALFFQGPVPSRAALIFSDAGVLAAMLLWTWGLAYLSGDKVSAAFMLTLIALATGLPPLGAFLGPHGLAICFALALLATSLVAVYVARRFISPTQDAAGRVLGGLVVGLAASSVMRFVWTLNYEGAPQAHLLHLPAVMLPVYAVLYGVLPFFICTTMLILVNGRLRSLLNVRASTDELTGQHTRRALRELAPEHISRARRSRLETALLMLDLDHFKAINDRHGHAIGDLVLRHAATLCRESLRPDSLLARYGGEEFVALVPVEDVHAARLVAERMRNAVATADWAMVAQAGVAVTTSVGVTLVKGTETLDEAMRRADDALYRAKGEGRNQVRVALGAA
jgi:diguanylate cyclase (GGDEF)-like protein